MSQKMSLVNVNSPQTTMSFLKLIKTFFSLERFYHVLVSATQIKPFKIKG